MINRTLVAALVGLSLAAGTFGTASAQTSTPTSPSAAASASPADAAAPTTATKSDATRTDATIKKTKATTQRRSQMLAKTHRKHLSHRSTKAADVAAAHATKSGAKRIRLSHATRHGAPKHV